jgi:putative tryptophan/tyrosine transport system substrate-binding protein
VELPRRRCSGDGKRRLVTKLTIGLVLLLFAVPSAATAQQPRKVYRVGYLYEGVPHSEALSEGLRDLGWVLGENLVIEYRQADGPPEHLQALLTDLLQLNVDVIVVVNTRLATAAKRMTQTVPLVVSVGDPVRTGLGIVRPVRFPSGRARV